MEKMSVTKTVGNLQILLRLGQLSEFHPATRDCEYKTSPGSLFYLDPRDTELHTIRSSMSVNSLAPGSVSPIKKTRLVNIDR